MPDHRPVIVFDLDGTLADTAVDLVATLNRVLAREGLPPLPVDQARDMIGAGARALIERGFAAVGQELTPDRLDHLFRLFLADYDRHLCVHSQLYPGVGEAIDALSAAGCVLAVCTNKMETHSVRLLDALGIADRFAAICGRDTFPYFKPDPRHLRLTIARAGAEAAAAVMIGDSLTDIATARAAGVPVVAVTFGYTDRPVRELDPDVAIDHFDELVPSLRRLIPLPSRAPSARPLPAGER